jgi:hypothetical protein
MTLCIISVMKTKHIKSDMRADMTFDMISAMRSDMTACMTFGGKREIIGTSKSTSANKK